MTVDGFYFLAGMSEWTGYEPRRKKKKEYVHWYVAHLQHAWFELGIFWGKYNIQLENIADKFK